MYFLYLSNTVSRQQNFDYLKINLASPSRIKSWAKPQSRLGEVTDSGTLNYRNLKPTFDGLFCERIFGTVDSFSCPCGNIEGSINTTTGSRKNRCEICNVYATDSVVRRWRMGFIDLKSPVVHVWYLGKPNRIASLLEMKVEELEQLVYYYTDVPIKVDDPLIDKLRANLKDVDEILGIEDDSDDEEEVVVYPYHYTFHTGGEAIGLLLDEIDLRYEAARLRSDLVVLADSSEEDKIWMRRLRLLEQFLASECKPVWMVLTALPILPPDLRPILRLENGEYASSDLNNFYRRVVTRNNRLLNLQENWGSPGILISNEKRLLQEAVDYLIQNGNMGPEAITDSSDRPLKSLSDIIRGKEGRIRQNLLGKRVDYSGRSVITSGADLDVIECGLPVVMATELFQPFLIHYLLQEGHAESTNSALEIIRTKKTLVRLLLMKIVDGYPIIINRAPTLHRLSIQAFRIILTPGQAIRFPSVVCVAFNADFDGDQVAVHLPLSLETVFEAITVLLSVNSVLTPANGALIMGPTQDMVVGLHYLAEAYLLQNASNIKYYFASFSDVRNAYLLGQIPLQALVWVRLNTRIPKSAKAKYDYNYYPFDDERGKIRGEQANPDYIKVKKSANGEIISIYLCTTPGRILFNTCLN